MDTSLMIKRALIYGISTVTGLLITLAIVFGPMETDIETYSITYFVLTWIPISALFVIWGDFFLDAKILPD